MISPCEDGFTLVELIVALALFALISLAGVRLIDSVVGVERGTGGRIERLADLQRAMFAITTDFEQLRDGPTREGTAVTLVRRGAGHDRAIRYRLGEGGLHRSADGVDRVLIGDVEAIDWRFHAPGRGWRDQPTLPSDRTRPDAVELIIRLVPRANAARGTLRRLVALPAEAT